MSDKRKSSYLTYSEVGGDPRQQEADLNAMKEIYTSLRDISDRVLDNWTTFVADHGDEYKDLSLAGLEKHILDYHVAPVIGDDKLGRLIAHAIVTGKYLI